MDQGWSGPSLLLMRGAKEDLIDLRTAPQQLSFWPCVEPELRMSAPGSTYPWLFHERMQMYIASCVHPAIAAVQAEEDVRIHNARLEREEREVNPPLFDVA